MARSSTFPCPSCSASLKRTEQMVPGAIVQCPRCQFEFPVPEEDAGHRYDRDEQLQNEPRRSRRPEYDEDVPLRFESGLKADLSGTSTLDIGECMGAAQKRWGEFLGPAIGFLVFAFAINFVIGLGTGILRIGIRDLTTLFFMEQGINFVVSVFLQGVLMVGLPYTAARVLRRERWQFGDFFAGFTQYPQLVLLNIIHYVLSLTLTLPIVLAFVMVLLAANPNLPPNIRAAVPFVLSQDLLPVVVGVALVCLVAAIYVLIRLSYASLLIVDQKLSAIEALGASWKITDGKVLSLIGLGFILGFISLLGALACGIGLLFALPLVFLAQGAAYLQLTGQMRGGGSRSRSYDEDDDDRRRKRYDDDDDRRYRQDRY